MNKTSIGMLAGGLLFAAGLGIKLTDEDTGTAGTTGTTDVKTKIYIPSDKTHRDLLDADNLSWQKIAEHYPPGTGMRDWKALHAKEIHWRKGFSAYELADSWEKAQPELPPNIDALFRGPAKLLAAIPEHKTPLPGGRRASQSDVLAFVRTKGRVCAVAVEGKKDEAFGEVVGDWLKGASAGKIERLKFISEKLGIDYPPADEIRYQLLHRTASAVIEAGRFNADCAAMIVQSFSPEHTHFSDFATFLNLFGISRAEKDKIYKTDKPGMALYLGWASP